MYTADDGRKGGRPAPSVLVLVEGFHWGGRTQTCHALRHRMIICSRGCGQSCSEKAWVAAASQCYYAGVRLVQLICYVKD